MAMTARVNPVIVSMLPSRVSPIFSDTIWRTNGARHPSEKPSSTCHAEINQSRPSTHLGTRRRPVHPILARKVPGSDPRHVRPVRTRIHHDRQRLPLVVDVHLKHARAKERERESARRTCENRACQHTHVRRPAEFTSNAKRQTPNARRQTPTAKLHASNGVNVPYCRQSA